VSDDEPDKNAKPELGQAFFGNPWAEYDCPQWVDALVRELLANIERAFWNKHQRHWDHYEDPKILGIEFRPYYWGDDEHEANLPNLSHAPPGQAAIEVRWYKHPMRSATLNVEPKAEAMIAWFESAMQAIADYEREAIFEVSMV
jgi:hypothetical protein